MAGAHGMWQSLVLLWKALRKWQDLVWESWLAQQLVLRGHQKWESTSTTGSVWASPHNPPSPVWSTSNPKRRWHLVCPLTHIPVCLLGSPQAVMKHHFCLSAFVFLAFPQKDVQTPNISHFAAWIAMGHSFMPSSVGYSKDCIRDSYLPASHRPLLWPEFTEGIVTQQLNQWTPLALGWQGPRTPSKEPMCFQPLRRFQLFPAGLRD